MNRLWNRRELLATLLAGGVLSALDLNLARAGGAAMFVNPEPKSPVSDAFTRALYSRLAEQPGNLAVSPASIEAAIMLALAGARGTTADEIVAALQLPKGSEASMGQLLDRAADRLAPPPVRSAIPKLPRSKAPTEKPPTSKLAIANSIWVQSGYPIHPAYRKLLETNHRAAFETADFRSATEIARLAINAWVEKQTADKIKQLLAAKTLTPDTRLVLANAVYFRGIWQEPFEKWATRQQPFHRPGQPDITVPLMHQSGHFRYTESEKFQAVELAYKNSPYTMVIWLPRKAEQLAAVEKTLVGEGATASLAKLASVRVNLFLPRFKVGSNLSLGDLLGEMGMKQAFTDAADFSGISNEPLKISAVIHKAMVEVDEIGTEAAAATAVLAAPASALAEPVKEKLFRADHPFVFGIRHATSGDLLFMGRVDTPEVAEKS